MVTPRLRRVDAIGIAVAVVLLFTLIVVVRDGSARRARVLAEPVTLADAVAQNRADAFLRLLDAGADPTALDAHGNSPMQLAAGAADGAFFDALAARHVDPNAGNVSTGATPLMAAIDHGRDDRVAALLKMGADPNRTDSAGNTALHVAAKDNDFQAALVLLDAGAKPSAQNKRGVTFRTYLAMTPASALTDAARGQRDAVDTWLRTHGQGG